MLMLPSWGLFKADILCRKLSATEEDASYTMSIWWDNAIQWCTPFVLCDSECGLNPGGIYAAWHPTTTVSLSQVPKMANRGGLRLAGDSVHQRTKLKLPMLGLYFSAWRM